MSCANSQSSCCSFASLTSAYARLAREIALIHWRTVVLYDAETVAEALFDQDCCLLLALQLHALQILTCHWHNLARRSSYRPSPFHEGGYGHAWRVQMHMHHARAVALACEKH